MLTGILLLHRSLLCNYKLLYFCSHFPHFAIILFKIIFFNNKNAFSWFRGLLIL